MLQWPSKDPAETLDYDVIWIDRIDPNDYIVSCTFTPPLGADIVVVSTSFSAPLGTSKVILSGGTLGTSYLFDCRITTFGGDVMKQSVLLDMVTK